MNSPLSLTMDEALYQRLYQHLFPGDGDEHGAVIVAGISQSASFSFAASENDSTFQCKLDNNTFGPCVSGQSYSNLADGVHSFTVKATDAAGNTGPETSYSWTVDTIAPEVIFDVKPGATS